MNKKLIYITNIPTPYRNKRFNTMAEIFPNHGIDFEVYYMAWIEPNRHWKLDKTEMKYKYRVFSGVHPTIGNMFAHFNPGLLWQLLTTKYDIAVVGGMASPSHWLAPFFIPNKALKILSVESNMDSVRLKGGIGAWIKRLLIRKHSGFQVTGERAIEYIKYFNPKVADNFITLPNVIDQEKYSKQVEKFKHNRDEIRETYKIDKTTQLWFCPSRLEKIKGLHLLLPLLKNLKGIKLLIGGSGSMKEELNRLIAAEKLPVELLGYLQEEQMLKLYASADLFILPSLSDPSPLSPIEALAAKLPIVVSTKIGNLTDVYNGNNGFKIDMDASPKENRKLLERVATLDKDTLHKMGKVSNKLFNENFDIKMLINNYAISVNELRNKQQQNNLE